MFVNPAMLCLPCVYSVCDQHQSTSGGIREDLCFCVLLICVCVCVLGCLQYVCACLVLKCPGHKRISFEEFLPLYNSQRQKKEQGSMEDFIEGLKVFDKEGNGLINSAELRHVLTSLGKCTHCIPTTYLMYAHTCTPGEKLTDDEVDVLLSGVEDSQGQVQYEGREVFGILSY